jgi:hypothetical protein
VDVDLILAIAAAISAIGAAHLGLVLTASG